MSRKSNAGRYKPRQKASSKPRGHVEFSLGLFIDPHTAWMQHPAMRVYALCFAQTPAFGNLVRGGQLVQLQHYAVTLGISRDTVKRAFKLLANPPTGKPLLAVEQSNRGLRVRILRKKAWFQGRRIELPDEAASPPQWDQIGALPSGCKSAPSELAPVGAELHHHEPENGVQPVQICTGQPVQPSPLWEGQPVAVQPCTTTAHIPLEDYRHPHDEPMGIPVVPTTTPQRARDDRETDARMPPGGAPGIRPARLESDPTPTHSDTEQGGPAMPRTTAASSTKLPPELEPAFSIRHRLAEVGFSVAPIGEHQDRLGFSLTSIHESASSSEELGTLLRISLAPEELSLLRAEMGNLLRLFAWERKNPGRK